MEERVQVTSSECVGAFIGPVSAFSASDTNNSGRFQLHKLCETPSEGAQSWITDAACRRCRGRPGRTAYHHFGEAAINSSSALNSKRRREPPPKIFQRSPNPPAHIHKSQLPPSLPHYPFFPCSVRQVNEKNKITLCISSTL